MSPEWDTIASGTVGDNRKVPIPDELVDVFDVEGMDLTVFWNYDKSSEFLILSTRPLDQGYQPVSRTDIYEENGYPKIRPPNQFSETILSKFFEGNEMFYLAYEEMVTGDDPRSVYLLTRKQVLELLPQSDDADRSELQDRILNTPGFIQSV